MSEEKAEVLLEVGGRIWPWPVNEFFMKEFRARAAREETVNVVVLDVVLLVKEGGGV